MMALRIILALLLTIATPPAKVDAFSAQIFSSHQNQLGVWTGFDHVVLAPFAAWNGRAAQMAVNSIDQTSRTAFNNDCGAQVSNYDDWHGATLFGIPLITGPGGVGSGSETLAQAAAGNFVTSWQTCLQTIFNHRHLIEIHALVRVSWEMNGSFQPWYAGGGRQADFITAWRLLVSTARAIDPTFFQFCWCPNIASGADDPTSMYPGDDVVDDIGMDAYYDIAFDNADGNIAFNFFEGINPGGFDWQVSFAQARNKSMSWPEWGVNSNAGGAQYIHAAASFFRANNATFRFQSYWMTNAAFQGDLISGQYPLASVAYIQEFGQ